jgi:hypothetical protein
VHFTMTVLSALRKDDSLFNWVDLLPLCRLCIYCLSVCQAVYLSVKLSICLSICLLVCLSTSLTFYPSVHQSVCLSVLLSACQSVWLLVCLSFYISIYIPSLSVHPSKRSHRQTYRQILTFFNSIFKFWLLMNAIFCQIKLIC